MTSPTTDGPTSTDQVAAMLALADPEEAAPAVAAVNSLVRGWLAPAPDGVWAPHHTYGATLLAARFHRRKDSPAGFQLQGMEAAAYVSRNDPDVAQLLGLGSWTPPRVG